MPKPDCVLVHKLPAASHDPPDFASDDDPEPDPESLENTQPSNWHYESSRQPSREHEGIPQFEDFGFVEAGGAHSALERIGNRANELSKPRDLPRDLPAIPPQIAAQGVDPMPPAAAALLMGQASPRRSPAGSISSKEVPGSLNNIVNLGEEVPGSLNNIVNLGANEDADLELALRLSMEAALQSGGTAPPPPHQAALEHQQFKEVTEIIHETAEVEYTVTLDKSEGGELGLMLDLLGHEQKIEIKGLKGRGLVQAWNERHPNEKVERGHRIIEVNGLRNGGAKMLDGCKTRGVIKLVLTKQVQKQRTVVRTIPITKVDGAFPFLPSGEWRRYDPTGKHVGSCEIRNDLATGRCEVFVSGANPQPVLRDASGQITCDGERVVSVSDSELVWSDQEVWRLVDAGLRPRLDSPAVVIGGAQSDSRRMVVLAGFKNTDINTFYMEQPAESYKLYGRTTYWSSKGDYFLFCNTAVNLWAVEKSKRFNQVKLGKSMGVAHSPKGFDLASATNESWWEWDKEVAQWVELHGSGVVRRGRARQAT
jgi:hypothetical protein